MHVRVGSPRRTPSAELTWQDSKRWDAEFAHVDTVAGEARDKARAYIKSEQCPKDERATLITDAVKKEKAYDIRCETRMKLGWPYPGEDEE